MKLIDFSDFSLFNEVIKKLEAEKKEIKTDIKFEELDLKKSEWEAVNKKKWKGERIMGKFFVEDNIENVFEVAIKSGLKNYEEYMYMYSTEDEHFFKHLDTREYIIIRRE